MIAGPITEKELVAQFLGAVRALPDVHAELKAVESAGHAADKRHDARIVLRVAGKPFTLLVEAKRRAIYPADVRQVVGRLTQLSRQRQARSNLPKTVPLLVAESISPGAKKMLREERIGYYDSGGSLFLPAHGNYFYIDRLPPKVFSKSVRSLFSGRRSQVLHALLAHHENWFGVHELAVQALVSPATVSQVLAELERFDWVVSRGQGPRKERHLRDPAALLDTWVKQPPANRGIGLHRYYVPAVKTDHLPERIDEVCNAHNVAYAISYEAAAQRYAPFLSSISQVRCRLLTGTTLHDAIDALGARFVSEGVNLVIVEVKVPGELLFRQRVDNVWLASPVQVYLDLSRSEGRAKEMADHLRKEKIGF